MVERYPKRLIEVDLPIKRISAHARQEKSVRRGHISALHTWWARRPLAACRSVLCASLWPDPVDDLCPESFRTRARQLILEFAQKALPRVKNNMAEECCARLLAVQKNPLLVEDNSQLRILLLDFISEFAAFDNSTHPDFLDTSRAFTQAAHDALSGTQGSRPIIIDPFAGGGSIPLEALRVGADAFASDLNAVPTLINKVMLEYLPKYGTTLIAELRTWGNWVRKAAEAELAGFYPCDAASGAPVAYFWARLITCEGPGCGAEVPVMRSLWLAKKPKRRIALKLIANCAERTIDFKVIENVAEREVGPGTAKRSSVTCPVCGYTTPRPNVEAQANKSRPKERLIAVATSRPGERGKHYRLPTAADFAALERARIQLDEKLSAHKHSLSLIPNEELPYLRSIFNVHVYGYRDWGSLFTDRQKLAAAVMFEAIDQARRRMAETHADEELSKAVATLLAFCADRIIANSNSLCWWVVSWEVASSAFARQALGMVWDFTEIYPFAEDEGWSKVCEWIAESLESLQTVSLRSGTVAHGSADQLPLPDDSVQLGFTDPPYYDAVPYADLSDFFYVWLRRSIGHLYPDLFSTELSPKDPEIVELAGRNQRYEHKTKHYFEERMSAAFADLRRVVEPGGLIVIVFAHTATESWEALLQAALNAGLVVTGSWPIDTEKTNRPRAQSSATLSSSVHIVCRPRENRDGTVITGEIGDWRDVLGELPNRIHDWMPRLAEEGVVGADAIFACLGPALEIFSRYSRVEKADGTGVALTEYLEHVWAAVAKEALAMVFQGADATGFEPDARLTAMWLWTLSAGATEGGSDSDYDSDSDEDSDASTKKTKSGAYVLEYDAARKIAQGLGASLENMPNVVEVLGDTARLLSPAERTKHLFGKDEAEASPAGRQKRKKSAQIDMFAELIESDDSEIAWKEKTVQRLGDTTLDRVHQSMILFAAGRSEALKRFLVEDGVGRESRFWRLAQALSALFPSNSEEKRWVDGVLARKKGLGF